MSHPTLPPDVIQTTDLLYYRFHGNEQLYASKYEDVTLQAFATDLKSRQDLKKAFIYFNNDINTHAVSNAMELKTMLSII